MYTGFRTTRNKQPKIPMVLPFITKTTTKPVTEMNVQVIGEDLVQQEQCFQFAKLLIEALRKQPLDKGVFFPKIEGGVCRAEVIVHLDYNDFGRPIATLIFFSTRLQMQMNYYVNVSADTHDSKPVLRLKTFFALKGKRPSIDTETMAKSYEEALNKIFTGFAVGGLHRKIGKLLHSPKA